MSRKHPLDTSGMNVGEAYKQIEHAKRVYGEDAIEKLKRQLTAQYRNKNMMLGGGLMAFGIGIYSYSIWKTKAEDIQDI